MLEEPVEVEHHQTNMAVITSFISPLFNENIEK